MRDVPTIPMAAIPTRVTYRALRPFRFSATSAEPTESRDHPWVAPLLGSLHRCSRIQRVGGSRSPKAM